MLLDAVGIILKKDYSSHYKIEILDKVRGKINGIIPYSSFAVGTLITYNIQHKATSYFIKDCTILYTPLCLAQNDILFFHHVLELMYYFNPLGDSNHDLFNLIAFLYSYDSTKITTLFKKIFLLKLLTTMGITPEHENYQPDIISQLNTINIKNIDILTINIQDEKKLDKWLWYCVWQHPYVNEFKTVHFLAKNRAL